MFYHLCFAVPDIEAAMAELTDALGTTWTPARDDHFAGWDCRLAFSVGDGPSIELVTGPPGSPWDGGPRFHHLGVWSGDVEATSVRLDARSCPKLFDARPLGRRYAYHELPSVGALVEVMDTARQPGFLQDWPQRTPVLTDVADLTTGRADALR